MSLEALRGLVDKYPWFPAGRLELAGRLCSMQKTDGSEIQTAALYVYDRSLLYRMAVRTAVPADPDLKKTEPKAPAPKVIVVGGDYFSGEDLASVDAPEVSFPSLAKAVQDDPDQQDQQMLFSDCHFYTETLARIYAEQGYFDRAEEVYSKLILLYPEKSAYFASLIEKLKS